MQSTREMLTCFALKAADEVALKNSDSCLSAIELFTEWKSLFFKLCEENK